MTERGNKTGQQTGRSNAVIAVACIAFVGAMVGAAYAAVPLYQIFCQVTGYGGTTQRAAAAPAVPIDREITVRFDANVASGLPWKMTPNERTVKLKVGAVRTTSYKAHSNGDQVTYGTATFNVTPFEAGVYFSKIDCFCFTEQHLKPGETADMGITFFIDPAIAEDKNLDYLKTITLSYTMFPDDPPEDGASAERADAGTPDDDNKRL
ncbi:cytochrome c oxidase assembly protein subunit 11 [Rhodobium orientis]|uniref:Cytochrome c oxidase assembly protein CtaG n=1 Tax=Rhodobium orientis TaxID=34017 RepID=A0A327JQX7_9HYPH|nr:cytochrome c oxidase assembly protein [Rhodobium orientis]MBB4304221.1 cytochrome c oxidase assembly protein subunit 11 [Rhodobium orientis]MBK5950690.1 cytochrome c oxidase assembly protein [Rhodobium orientis]RAI28065.1 cytochrome c oxidase assembly protein [Rhodobium orientis]